MFSATAYNHAYADTGLFCIHASAPPTYVKEMIQVIIKELINMAGEICPIELRVSEYSCLQEKVLKSLKNHFKFKFWKNFAKIHL